MRDFLRCCSAELLKLKRTLALRLAVLTPLVMVLLHSAAILRGRGLRGLWQSLEHGTIGWAILMLPLTAALLTALLNGIEHRENAWRQLFALPVPRWAVYGAKVVAAQLLLALSHVVLWCGIVVAGVCLHRALPGMPYGPVPFLPLLRLVALMYASAGALIAIQLWVSFRAKSFTVPLGLGISAVMVSVIGMRDSVMAYWPWMYPANASIEERWLPALLCGVGGGILISALAARDAGRRDVG